MPEPANPIKTSLSQDFCHHLMFHLSRAFGNCPNKYYQQFWCDGILVHDDNQLSLKNITGRQKIETQAWLGETGQQKYRMIIKLGRKSIGRSLKGLSLMECLPANDSLDWVFLDEENSVIELQLK